jgi:hypothetical protein
MGSSLVPHALELCPAGPDMAMPAAHGLGWVWKCTKLGATDDDPQRVNRLARIRWVFEYLKRGEAMVFADELAIHLLPKVGCARRSKGTHVTVMTPGQHQKHYLAGAL